MSSSMFNQYNVFFLGFLVCFWFELKWFMSVGVSRNIRKITQPDELNLLADELCLYPLEAGNDLLGDLVQMII